MEEAVCHPADRRGHGHRHDQAPPRAAPFNISPGEVQTGWGAVLSPSLVSPPACHLPPPPVSGVPLLTWAQIAHEKEKSDTKALLLASFHQQPKHKGPREKISNVR